MTVSQLLTLLAKHKISLDTPMVTASKWEGCRIGMDGVFYNPYSGTLEFTQGSACDLENHLDWECLSLVTDETSWFVDDDTIEYYIDEETYRVCRWRVQREPWYKFAKTLVRDFGSYSVYTPEGTEFDEDDEPEDDNVVYCPECGEPIYEDDYPEIIVDRNNKYVCPICWERFDKE